MKSVTAGGYGCNDDCCLVQLYSGAAGGGAGVSGVGLRSIGGNTGEVNESGCAAVQEDSTGFYVFSFDL